MRCCRETHHPELENRASSISFSASRLSNSSRQAPLRFDECCLGQSVASVRFGTDTTLRLRAQLTRPDGFRCAGGQARLVDWNVPARTAGEGARLFLVLVFGKNDRNQSKLRLPGIGA